MLLTQQKSIFPFSAIVGQEMMKESLLLNVIDPTIGGVLIRGKKGSAKSTACRALKLLLGKDTPFITLPLSATEDMIVGSIDFQEVLKSGRKEVSYGILNKVNNGILYIDEVNLLNSHLVELLLDAASFGINRIEREGISFEHASKFILIGTMNPEEGEVSPQFLDRFGLSVSIDNELNIDNRVLILQRREEFDKDPDAFISHFRSEEKRLAEKLKESKILVKQIIMTDDHRKLVTEIVLKNNCAGHRAEIIMSKTARAICTFENRDTVTIEDIQKAAAFVLPHRTREQKEPETNPSRPSDKKENNKQDNKNQE
ncbi:MAG: AAA family ATPase, partial [Candidatus Omnitrophica bacterium]|nr:AAA family ATPase [Candidatus Omnitrophota bacterium]